MPWSAKNDRESDAAARRLSIMSVSIDVATPDAPTGDPPYDLTIDLVSRMAEAGLFPRERRIYLRDGRLYEKMAKTKAHGFAGAALDRALNRALPEGWSLWPESTIVLDATNAPLPDFAVLRGHPLDYAQPPRYPVPADVGLLVEIAVSSLRDDLGDALERYARAGIPSYWVLDVPGRRLLAHADPRVTEGRGHYARVDTHRAGDAIPLVLDGREVARLPFDELLR